MKSASEVLILTDMYLNQGLCSHEDIECLTSRHRLECVRKSSQEDATHGCFCRRALVAYVALGHRRRRLLRSTGCATGSDPVMAAVSLLMISTAAAPSLTGLLLPAVTDQSICGERR